MNKVILTNSTQYLGALVVNPDGHRDSVPSDFGEFSRAAHSVYSAVNSRRRAFTLIEILVVLSIIVILMAILIPALVWAQKRAYITATTAEMNTISQALAAYHNDFNMYPNSSLVDAGNLYTNTIPQYSAYEYLAEALIGYLPGEYDGAPGNSALGVNGYTGGTLEQTKGFSMNPYNKVYGPYLDIGAAYIILDPTPLNANVPTYYIADSFPAAASGAPMPILYFSSSGTPTNNETIFVNGTGGIFNELDNTGGTPVASSVTSGNFTNFSSSTPAATTSMEAFLPLIGNTPATSVGTPSNTYSSTQNILGINSYLLISAGPDAQYFDGDDVVFGGP
jgi:prepilin-type N-terminal cleavage/methylation domain-containing protein